MRDSRTCIMLSPCSKVLLAHLSDKNSINVKNLKWLGPVARDRGRAIKSELHNVER
jgi:hypothetical protein